LLTLSRAWDDRRGVIVGYATGEARELPLRPTFDRRIKPEPVPLAVGRARWALPHNLLGFVDLETRPLQVLP
jgi:hypothetical protein